MKHVQVAASIEDRLLPTLYSVVSESSAVSELRVLDWNVAADDVATLLYAIDGESEVFRDAARDTDGVVDLTLSNVERPVSYALLGARPAAIPFFSAFVSVTARAGVVVRKPLVYRDGRSHGHVVGDPGPLQDVIDETPDGIDVQIERIGRFPSDADAPSSRLSDRQREVLETALRMGYYERPREATHADIAAELECAPTTVTTHLQKGEAKLVESAMAGLDD
ncbi:helix-turn-helix domain-containing protein [Halorussus halobius]|uniref:helix-turn-helix domain-containing protein n=1 Tax=Halorussus halobius TaxID=1710537 RepID=UPI001091F9FF|nr:helix-turn-helix domain-containing protein [Halorussus halobius]